MKLAMLAVAASLISVGPSFASEEANACTYFLFESLQIEVQGFVGAVMGSPRQISDGSLRRYERVAWDDVTFSSQNLDWAKPMNRKTYNARVVCSIDLIARQVLEVTLDVGPKVGRELPIQEQAPDDTHYQAYPNRVFQLGNSVKKGRY